MNEAIRAEHITFQYEPQEGKVAVPVFEDLSLTVEEGSFVAVLGHNGSGKSTLAKHFNAILLPQGGSIAVFGMDTADEARLIDVRRTVGMVFQNPDNQIVANVVEDDVAFAPENLGVEPEEIRRRVEEAMAQVGMLEYRQHAPHLLSGGQKQRVLLARALCAAERLLLLDEPVTGLDPESTGTMYRVIEDLHQKGMTVVMVTHDVDTALDDATRVMDFNKISTKER